MSIKLLNVCMVLFDCVDEGIHRTWIWGFIAVLCIGVKNSTLLKIPSLMLWLPSNLYYKSHRCPKLKFLSSGFAVVFVQSIDAKFLVENEDIVGASPVGAAPTTSQRLTSLFKDLSMMYRALWDRRHEGATRISQCTRRVAPSALTYSSGPWVPPISQCTIHHA